MTTSAPCTRRTVLRFGVAGAAGLASASLLPRLGRATTGETHADPAIVHTALSDSLHLFLGAGGNVVALAAPDGVLLVDGGLAQYRCSESDSAVCTMAGS